MLKRVYLEITNVCNLACSFCPGTKRQKRFMSEAEFAALTEKLRGKTQYLYFHLMGEPLLHPLLSRFLAIAEEKGFRVILTTNGTLLNEKGRACRTLRPYIRSTSRCSPSRPTKAAGLKIM